MGDIQITARSGPSAAPTHPIPSTCHHPYTGGKNSCFYQKSTKKQDANCPIQYQSANLNPVSCPVSGKHGHSFPLCFFVVKAASRLQRLEWCKKVPSEYFCMKTWALSEVLQVYVTPLSGVH